MLLALQALPKGLEVGQCAPNLLVLLGRDAHLFGKLSHTHLTGLIGLTPFLDQALSLLVHHLHLFQKAALPLLELGADRDQVLAELARVGAIGQRLRGIADRLDREAIEIEAQRSRAEDVDMTRVLLDLGGQEAALQAALSTTARVQQLSLFDYL